MAHNFHQIFNCNYVCYDPEIRHLDAFRYDVRKLRRYIAASHENDYVHLTGLSHGQRTATRKQQKQLPTLTTGTMANVVSGWIWTRVATLFSTWPLSAPALASSYSMVNASRPVSSRTESVSTTSNTQSNTSWTLHTHTAHSQLYKHSYRFTTEQSSNSRTSIHSKTTIIVTSWLLDKPQPSKTIAPKDRLHQYCADIVKCSNVTTKSSYQS